MSLKHALIVPALLASMTAFADAPKAPDTGKSIDFSMDHSWNVEGGYRKGFNAGTSKAEVNARLKYDRFTIAASIDLAKAIKRKLLIRDGKGQTLKFNEEAFLSRLTLSVDVDDLTGGLIATVKVGKDDVSTRANLAVALMDTESVGFKYDRLEGVYVAAIKLNPAQISDIFSGTEVELTLHENNRRGQDLDADTDDMGYTIAVSQRLLESLKAYASHSKLNKDATQTSAMLAYQFCQDVEVYGGVTFWDGNVQKGADPEMGYIAGINYNVGENWVLTAEGQRIQLENDKVKNQVRLGARYNINENTSVQAEVGHDSCENSGPHCKDANYVGARLSNKGSILP